MPQLIIKDARQADTALAAQLDVNSALATVHVAASLNANNLATPVAAAAPLPVMNTAGAVAIDGSTTITTDHIAKTLFASITPVNGYLIANNTTVTLYVCDVGGPAVEGGNSIPIAAGAVFVTPSGYKPAGTISIIGGMGSAGGSFAARRW